MELVHQYLHGNHIVQFRHVNQIWNQQDINGTPDIAQFIESIGITRHMYRTIKLNGIDIESQQSFYKNCLAMLIYLIDNQQFDDIEGLFDIAKQATKKIQDS